MQLGFDCRTCDSTLRKERGHDEKGIMPFHVGGEIVFRCPLMLVNKETWEYVAAYKFYKKNLLPSGQSYLFESKKYLDAMVILENSIDKTQNEKNQNTKQK